MQLKVGESANQKYLPFSKLYKGIAFQIILKSAKDLLQPRSTSLHGIMDSFRSYLRFLQMFFNSTLEYLSTLPPQGTLSHDDLVYLR